MKPSQVVIVKRRGRKSGVRQGNSSWKIAFADFTLSMMAVFLVMWVVSTASPEEQEIIGGYFTSRQPADSYVTGLPGAGEPMPVIDGIQPFPAGRLGEPKAVSASLSVSSSLWVLMEDLEQAGLNGTRGNYSGNLNLEVLSQGVRIYISESDDRPMFDRGSKSLTPFYEDLLLGLAPFLAKADRGLSITGHSDASESSGGQARDNWYLSSYRANGARETLVYGGFPSDRIVQVSAMADRQLVNPDEPYNPVNRRVEIIVLTAESEHRLTNGVYEPGEQEPAVTEETVTEARNLAEGNQIPGQS